MTLYTGGEVKSMALQLKGEFNQLYADARLRYDVVDGRHGDRIVAALRAMSYPKIQPIVSREGEYAARKVVGILGAPVYEVHIAPTNEKDKGRADDLEIIDANLFLRMNPRNATRRAIHRHQAVSPYAALVLMPNADDRPMIKKGESPEAYNERVDRWRERWTPFRLSVDDPLAWAFYEDGNLNVTQCMGHYEIPVADFCRDFGDYDREEYTAGEADPSLMVQIWDQQFPGLRAGYAIAREEGRQGFGGMPPIRVCIVDDGEMMAWYAAVPSSAVAMKRKDWKAKEYHALSDASPHGSQANPFGIPCLVPIPGVFNQAATRPEDRYQPWLLPHIQSRYNEDLILSEWSSMAAERPIYSAPLPPDVLDHVRAMEPEQRQQFFRDLSEMREGRINPTFGKVDQLNAEVNQYMLQVWGAKHDEHRQYVPHSAWSASDDGSSVLKSTPVSSLLRLDELEGQDYSLPQELEIAGWLKVFQAHDWYWRHCDDEDEYARARTTGDEKRYGKETKRGQVVTLDPAAWDFDYERQLIAVDNRPSTIMQRLTVVQTREQMGLVTQEERITALGIEDATGYDEKLEAEEIYKTLKQAKMAFALVDSVTLTARTLGVDTTQYLMGAAAAGTAPTMTPAQPAGAPQDVDTGTRMNPPSRDAASVQAEAAGAGV